MDWNVRNFHGFTYSTHRGTTYNAYLILDDTITLVDSVYGPFAGELMARIKEIIDPAKIDYIIANHSRPTIRAPSVRSKARAKRSRFSARPGARQGWRRTTSATGTSRW